MIIDIALSKSYSFIIITSYSTKTDNYLSIPKRNKNFTFMYSRLRDVAFSSTNRLFDIVFFI